MQYRWLIPAACLTLWILPSGAGAPATEVGPSAPPPGIEISADDRMELAQGAAELGTQIEALKGALRRKPNLLALLPDVEIYHKAVRWAVAYDEFYRSNEVAIARTLLEQGRERARQLSEGRTPWTTATGLVVRGYASKIDGSAQPYGLVAPSSFARNRKRSHRLDIWLHGRDNHLTELKFINDRQKSYGEFTPPDTFVLHPYGRYCNAFKFAGEVDVFEALGHALTQYPVDDQRLAIRGFSMGGAGTWHLAAHHPGFWAAAAPGAGFAETAEYTKALSRDPKPPWYEQKLWHLYDATDYALNLFNCPTVAYSGELDKQKQAADIMARALEAEGLELVHLVGAGVEHKYEPRAKLELARRFDEIMFRGKNVLQNPIRFTTWTLRYNQMGWVTVDALARHWERAVVNAELPHSGLTASTTNVTGITFTLPPRIGPPSEKVSVTIDGQTFRLKSPLAQTWSARFRRTGSKWSLVTRSEERGLRKINGLQGPIDDAFLDNFLMVTPTGQPVNETSGSWVQNELAHATNEWRAQFRSEAPMKTDVQVLGSDISDRNLILWGDPQSNKMLARMMDKLPVRWTKSEVKIGRHAYPVDKSMPVLIYPNPLNPRRYVVLNTGFTFCEFGGASNAQQTPKLPDFAIVDITVERANRLRDGIRLAGFFGERWELREQ